MEPDHRFTESKHRFIRQVSRSLIQQREVLPLLHTVAEDEENGTDLYSYYEDCLDIFLKRLDQASDVFSFGLVLEQRLRENVKRARRYGDTPESRAERSEVMDQLNRVALENMGISFLEVGVSLQTVQRFPHGFDFVGVRETAVLIDLIAFVVGDNLAATEIAKRRDDFFTLTSESPHYLGLKSRGRKPNGLLCFVFAEPAPNYSLKLIKKQSKITHHFRTGAVIVSWSIDLTTKRIHTHTNPVSWIPPVIIFASQSFPGKNYLQQFI